MKPWTRDMIIGTVLIVGMGIAVGVTMPPAVLMFWISGVFMGYGLRIGIVNVWPHIFRPRRSYPESPKQTT